MSTYIPDDTLGDDGYWSFDAADIAMGIPRGIAGGVSDMVNLPAMLMGEEVPDKFGWESKSTTIGGDITEGLFNFAAGLVPGLGIASKLGKGAKFAKAATRIQKAVDSATEASMVARKAGRIGQAAMQARKAKALSQIPELAKFSFASSFADFAAFDGHEARLSNLLRDYVGLRDPVTEFLAADENDGEIVGRLKNAIEGFGIGFAVDGLLSALRVYRAGARARSKGVEPTVSMVQEARKIRDAQERDLMESFGLNEEEARYTNLLIDAFGLDRGRLKIIAGEDAIEFYSTYSDEVLAQMDRGTYSVSSSLPDSHPIKFLLTDSELDSLKSPARLKTFLERADEANTTVFGLLDRPRTAGESALAEDGEAIKTLGKLIGTSRAQLYVLMSRFEDRRTGIGLTELVMDSIRTGAKRIDRAELAGRFTTEFEGSVKEVADLADQILKDVEADYKAASKLDPSITRTDVLDNMDMSKYGEGLEARFDGQSMFTEARTRMPVDSHTSSLVPNDMITRGILTDSKGVSRTQSWLEAKRDWIASRPEILQTYNMLRKVATVTGLESAPINDRILRTLAMSSSLIDEGVSPEDILKRFSREDLVVGWDLITNLTRKEIREELVRSGIDAAVIENLDRFARRVRSKFRLKAGQAVTSADVAAAKAGSRVVSRGRDLPNRATLLSAADGTVRGFAKTVATGLTYIGGLRAPNLETAVHELAHVARHQLFDSRIPRTERFGLTDKDILTIEKWAGVARDGDGAPVWTVDAEERFAEGLVEWIRNGTPPIGNMRGVFERLSMWLTSLWKSVGTEVPGVTKEVAEVFEKLANRGPGVSVTGVNTFVAETSLLRSASKIPFDSKGGGTGDLRPPDYVFNIERSSTVSEVREEIDKIVIESVSRMPPETVKWEDIAPQVIDTSQSLARMLNDDDVLGDPASVARISGQYALKQMIVVQQAMRQILSDVSAKVVSIAKKGDKASSAELYEFLRLQKIAEVVVDEVRINNASFARGLNMNRRVPKPRAFVLAPPLPGATPGAVPSITGGASAGGRAGREGGPVPRAGGLSSADEPSARGAVGEGGTGTGTGTGEGYGTPSPSGAADTAAGSERLAPDGTAVGDPTAPRTETGTVPETDEVGAGGTSAAPTASSPVSSDALSEALIDDAIEQAGGRDAVVSMMDKIVRADASGGAEGAIGLIRGARNWGNVIVEYWMNSILSGPVTHMVNITANTMTLLYLPFERALGAALVGDFGVVGNQMRLYMNYLNQIGDSFRIAKQATMKDQSILEEGMRQVEIDGNTISAQGLGFKEDRLSGAIANWIGNVVNLPTRFLASEDEFFKQLHYRAHFKTNLQVEGLKKFRGDSAAAAKWSEDIWSKNLEDGQRYSEANMIRKAAAIADERVSKGLLDAGEKNEFVNAFMSDPNNWSAEAGILSRESLEQARYATFTTPLDPQSNRFTTRLAAKAQAIANDMPWMRFVFPFIRTPTNLLNFSIARFPVANNMVYAKELFSLFRKDLSMGDRGRRADILGRMALGLGAVSTFYLMAQSGKITGGGPREKSRKELWEATGWQPYSIKIGDKYVSYRRFDPFSTIIGLVADMIETGNDLMKTEDKDTVDFLGIVLVTSIARNVTNKTYLTGLTNLVNAISSPEQFSGVFLNNFAGSMVPFSGLTSQSIGLFTDDPVHREVRGMVDAMRSRIPLLEESVAPRRNLFGEEIKKADRPPGPLSFLPVEYREDIDDPVMLELRNLDHGFTRPSVRKNNLDLTSFKTTSGQQAYDRWLQLHGEVEIGGMTLRERLTKLIKNKGYKALSDISTDEYDSPRVRLLRSIISKYRARAYYEMLKEAPVLRESDRINFMNREALRRGASMDELQTLIRAE